MIYQITFWYMSLTIDFLSVRMIAFDPHFRSIKKVGLAFIICKVLHIQMKKWCILWYVYWLRRRRTKKAVLIVSFHVWFLWFFNWSSKLYIFNCTERENVIEMLFVKLNLKTFPGKSNTESPQCQHDHCRRIKLLGLV